MLLSALILLPGGFFLGGLVIYRATRDSEFFWSRWVRYFC
jgi:hypothetical protein